MRAIIDSDVLIDYLQGLDPARRELDRYAQREISII
jgi:predicted nucleic acid-binding protein